jgi:hypothetical protein
MSPGCHDALKKRKNRVADLDKMIFDPVGLYIRRLNWDGIEVILLIGIFYNNEYITSINPALVDLLNLKISAYKTKWHFSKNNPKSLILAFYLVITCV